MKCENCLDVIEEYFDKELSALVSIEVAAHLIACPTCAEMHEALKQEQTVYASYKRDLPDISVVWQGIEARIKEEMVQPAVIQQEIVEQVGFFERLRNFFAETMRAPRFSPALAAALVIVAVGATIVVMNYLNSRSGNNGAPVAINNDNGGKPDEKSIAPNGNAPQQKDPASQVAMDPEKKDVPQKLPERETPGIKQVRTTPERVIPPPANDPNSSTIANKLVRDAEQKYLAAITILKRDYDKRRTQLDPQFVAKMDAALSTIDNTIAETRKAVRQNSDDPIALQYMLAAYAKKVEVLKGVAGS